MENRCVSARECRRTSGCILQMSSSSTVQFGVSKKALERKNREIGARRCAHLYTVRQLRLIGASESVSSQTKWTLNTPSPEARRPDTREIGIAPCRFVILPVVERLARVAIVPKTLFVNEYTLSRPHQQVAHVVADAPGALARTIASAAQIKGFSVRTFFGRKIPGSERRAHERD
jgi:hypothetical protein